MNLKNLFAEKRAVSPVIGVILMVAITVILAAVIGTFVLGLGESVQTTPQAKFNFDYDEGNNDLTITHDGGDAIESSNLNITTSDGTDEAWSGSDDVSAGGSMTLSDVGSGETVRVVWSDPNTDKSATLGRWSGPDA